MPFGASGFLWADRAVGGGAITCEAGVGRGRPTPLAHFVNRLVRGGDRVPAQAPNSTFEFAFANHSAVSLIP